MATHKKNPYLTYVENMFCSSELKLIKVIGTRDIYIYTYVTYVYVLFAAKMIM